MECSYGCGNEGLYELKNGKVCCSSKYQECPSLRKKNSDGLKKSYVDGKFKNITENYVLCEFCNEPFTKYRIKFHEPVCFMNPDNLKLCLFCGTPVRDKNSRTCSNSCSNKFFKQAKGRPCKPIEECSDSYRRICFKYHKKKCIICDENIIIDVHHFDGNHNNENPENVLPLCPTHHKYMHSKHKNLILEKVLNYIENFMKGNFMENELVKEIKFKCPSEFLSGNSEKENMNKLARYILNLIHFVCPEDKIAFEKDSGYAYQLGPTNDWWFDKSRDGIKDEYIIVHRYGNPKELMDSIKNVLVWGLGIEKFN